MKQITQFIQEKLKINSNSKVNNCTLTDGEFNELSGFFNTCCTLFHNVNKFFTDKNIKKCITTETINLSEFKDVIKGVNLFLKKLEEYTDLNDKFNGYPNTPYKDNIDEAILEGLKKYYNDHKK